MHTDKNCILYITLHSLNFCLAPFLHHLLVTFADVNETFFIFFLPILSFQNGESGRKIASTSALYKLELIYKKKKKPVLY